MYNNNIIIDTYNKIQIPQNENSFFMIKKSCYIKNTIEIHIQPFEEINSLNLYLMIKSYVCNIIYVPSNIFISIKNTDEKSFIAYNSNISEIKHLTYYGFLKWFYEQLHHDWKYIKENGSYFLLITYTIDTFDSNLLNYIKPVFPWKSELIEKFNKLKIDEEYYIKTIEIQKNEIKKLQKKIEELEKKK